MFLEGSENNAFRAEMNHAPNSSKSFKNQNPTTMLIILLELLTQKENKYGRKQLK